MIHEFESSSEAYDACQCDEDIEDGDVLVVRPERVVGVANTWPFAVTKEHGDLHALKGASEQALRDNLGDRRVQGWKNALAVAKNLGF